MSETHPPLRAADPGVMVEEFAGLVWRHCPKCDGPARVTHELHEELRSNKCGHLQQHNQSDTPLYLSATVGGEELWVYNVAHLDALAAWLGASLRERSGDDGLVNKTMMSRLPRWMKSAKNRPKVIQALAKLRDTARREGLS
jgi:hypothetical protein